jgi:hypothetical protein
MIKRRPVRNNHASWVSTAQVLRFVGEEALDAGESVNMRELLPGGEAVDVVDIVAGGVRRWPLVRAV